MRVRLIFDQKNADMIRECDMDMAALHMLRKVKIQGSFGGSIPELNIQSLLMLKCIIYTLHQQGFKYSDIAILDQATKQEHILDSYYEYDVRKLTIENHKHKWNIDIADDFDALLDLFLSDE
jgi:hypothetical protein